MKNTIALIALAGIASAASAQVGSFSIVPSAATVDSTGAAVTITLAVYGDADFGTAISGGGFGLSANGGAGLVSSMSAEGTAWGALGHMDLGDGSDGNYNGLIFGQFIFPPALPAHADSLLGSGPVLIGTMTVNIAADTSGVIEWSTVDSVGDFALEIFDGADGSYTQLMTASVGTASVTVTPAPSALALLGLGGIAAGRRRR